MSGDFFEETDFFEAVRLVNLLECQIWIDFPQWGETDSEGYELIPVFILSDEEIFLQLYDQMLKLYHLVPSNSQMLEWAFVEPRPDLGLDELIRRGGVVQPLLRLACARNRAVRHDPILWFQAEWAHDWMETLDVAALTRWLHDSGCEVFYRITSEFPKLNQSKKDPKLLTITLYFKLVKSPGFYKWVESIKATLPLKYVFLLTDYNERFSGGITPDFAAIQSYPQLTPETLHTFLQEIGYSPP